MKTNKFFVMTFAILMMSGLFVSAVSANGAFPSLPPTAVTLSLTEPVRPFPVVLTNVPSGYDVTDGQAFTGWCIDIDNDIYAYTDYWVVLNSSLAPPTEYAGFDWNRINYILNNKQGNAYEIQEAIWYFIEPIGYKYRLFDPSEIPASYVDDMVDAANSFGGSFVPGEGEILAIICDPVEEDVQSVIIEITVPTTGTEGLTPGFWKNHLGAWVGYDPDDLFSDVAIFDRLITIDQGKKSETIDPTLLEALKAKDGVNEDKDVYDALARHAVAALLNAAHPDVDYPLTVGEIISKVQSAIDSGNAEMIKNELESYNTLGATL